MYFNIVAEKCLTNKAQDDTDTDATQRVYFRVRYLSPVRGSRTVAWAEKTMNETLILGLKRNQTLEISFVQNI